MSFFKHNFCWHDFFPVFLSFPQGVRLKKEAGNGSHFFFLAEMIPVEPDPGNAGEGSGRL